MDVGEALNMAHANVIVHQRTGAGQIFLKGVVLDTVFIRPSTVQSGVGLQTHLIAGRLVIVCQGDNTELVPRVIADKIAERDASLVVRVNKTSTEIDADDPYAAFQIPDDLMW